MTTIVEAPPRINTLADLLERLGNIPLERIRFHPYPGTATVQDVIHADVHEDRICELIDGVLVEKAMGLRESLLAGAMIGFLREFIIPQNLGVVSGEAGTMQLFEGLVRVPDVAFASWRRVSNGRIPEEPVPLLVPDLAVEILSKGNTPQEMHRKRGEFFAAGVRLVWMVDPKRRTVRVYTSPEQFTELGEDDTLTGGDVLPGFALPLRDLFAELDRVETGGRDAASPIAD